MKALNIFLLNTLLLATLPALAQDSVMVKKPSPTARVSDQMPIRRGKGTARPMPSPQYKLRMVPMRTDTNRTRNRHDTTK